VVSDIKRNIAVDRIAACEGVAVSKELTVRIMWRNGSESVVTTAQLAAMLAAVELVARVLGGKVVETRAVHA
jgi:hypothetical protein